ncbi:Uncharacterized protein GBIM_19390 [Gryllus bimaculatus]|nr:Uncharacterized protein GBIM_19390 [Gryllus bimaculatus]
MSDNRQLVSDIQELDKNITNCEQFFAKVLNRKIEGSRQAPANKKKNVPAKSSSRPQSRGGGSQALHRAPSAGASSTRTTTKSANPCRKSVAVIHSQPRKASADRLPKPKSNDGHQRRRSNSASRLVSKSCTCEPPTLESFGKFPVHVPRISASKVSEIQVPVKLETSPRTHQSRSPGSKSKNLSWGQILGKNHQTCKVDRGQWDIHSARQNTHSHPSFNTKIPHDCEPIKECSSSECTVTASCNHLFKVTAPRRPQEESFSSEGTSGFSSNNELPSHLTNKSIQCGLPNPGQRPKSSDSYHHQPSSSAHYQHRRVSSSSSGASSQKPEEKEKVIGVLGSDVFSIFNPVRTLNFLVKELQGLLQKHPQDDESARRVIADMEKALRRLPEGEEPTESTSGYTTHSKPHDSHSVSTSASTRSCDMQADKLPEEVAQQAAMIRALQTVPALARRIDERTEAMRRKIVESRTRISVPAFAPPPQESCTSSVENILRLQRHVESSGHQLEIMCQAMEQTCDILRSERDALQGKVEERDKKLRVAKSQEQDFVTTVTSLRTNLESATRRVTQLSVENKVLKEQVKEIPNLRYIEEKYKQVSIENAKLKEENKAIPALKEKEAKVAELTSSIASLETEKKNLDDKVVRCNQEIQRLKESSQNQVGVAEATKRLTQRLQETMKERDEAQHDAQMLRIEREKLLILQRNKDEELSHFVQDIINIKMMVTGQLNILKTNMPQMTPPGSILDLLNSSSESEEFTSASQCQPVCSSPTSTASGAAPGGEVWEDISTIVPEQTRSSPEVFVRVSTQKGEETESPPDFKSLCRDAWHSLAPAGQGEGCGVPETNTPRPRTAVPSQRPPVAVNEGVGDTQWTGAAAVTQELHQNVQELFKLINNKPAAAGSTDAPSSGRTVTTVSSSVPSSKRSSVPAQATNKNFQFEIPRLPDPPKFLETPEFSDFSSYHGSLADTSSVESIDAVLRKLQKGDRQTKEK